MKKINPYVVILILVFVNAFFMFYSVTSYGKSIVLGVPDWTIFLFGLLFVVMLGILFMFTFAMATKGY